MRHSSGYRTARRFGLGMALAVALVGLTAGALTAAAVMLIGAPR